MVILTTVISSTNISATMISYRAILSTDISMRIVNQLERLVALVSVKAWQGSLG